MCYIICWINFFWGCKGAPMVKFCASTVNSYQTNPVLPRAKFFRNDFGAIQPWRGKKNWKSPMIICCRLICLQPSSHRKLFTGPFNLSLGLSSHCVASWRESHLEAIKTIARSVDLLQYISFTYSSKMCQVTNFVPIKSAAPLMACSKIHLTQI